MRSRFETLTLWVCSAVSFLVMAAWLRADPGLVVVPVLRDCTHKSIPCAVKTSFFGDCCLAAGGLGAVRLPNSDEPKDALPGENQCGATFRFFIYPCARATGAGCGGIANSGDDCIYKP